MKKLWIALISIIAIAVVTGSIYVVYNFLSGVYRVGMDYEAESLRWARIGAIGSWIGSVFGAIALLISLAAFRLPQKIKMEASISCGFLMSQMPGIDKTDAYVITVKNTGIKPVTVNNVYLHFGRNHRSGKDIYVGTLNQNTILGLYDVKFPQRIEQGESFSYYLQRDNLIKGLTNTFQNQGLSRDDKFSICVDEAIEGRKYFKTKWSLKTFIG